MTCIPSLSDILSANFVRFSFDLLKTFACEMLRTFAIAWSCVSAWYPLPMIPAVIAGRLFAMYFVATPDAAPVLICPMRFASMTASKVFDDVSYSITWNDIPVGPAAYDLCPAMLWDVHVADMKLYAPEFVGSLFLGVLNAFPSARALNTSSSAEIAVCIDSICCTWFSVM